MIFKSEQLQNSLKFVKTIKNFLIAILGKIRQLLLVLLLLMLNGGISGTSQLVKMLNLNTQIPSLKIFPNSLIQWINGEDI